MNHGSIITITIALLFTSQLVNAGEITDTYTTGDALTTTTLDNIKTAVNDNDTRTTINASNISASFSGDGSAGDLTIISPIDWNSTPPVNPYFGNITIEAGQTLTVPAGSTIRCAGTFTNYGTLIISPGARMGSLNNFAFGATPDIYSMGHPGDSFRPASGGAYYTNGIAVPKLIQGGMGGESIPEATAATSFNSFRIGGGSGSGWRDSGRDGDGGGVVRIYCSGDIVNEGTIEANGTTSNQLSGGGGGGIIILASSTSVVNDVGTINANGGNGGPSFSFGGAGGGGGGGITIFVAPSISVAGTVTVNGGSGGSTVTQVTSQYRQGGGAGGASGGNGGNGSDLSSAASVTPSAPGIGGDGYTIEILANPANMMN